MNRPRPRSRPHQSRCRRERGFAMLEALVGGLVFAIGVLGVVALQASMTQAQTTGQFRGDATYLSSELVGLLWADVPNLARYDSSLCAAYVRCDDWADKVARLLPGATTTVAVNAATGVVSITISWTTRSGVQRHTTTTAVAA
jgi:type IV pilus assembly protein PilV